MCIKNYFNRFLKYTMADFDDDGCDICTSDMQDSEVEDS